jgi:hypothetical protein
MLELALTARALLRDRAETVKFTRYALRDEDYKDGTAVVDLYLTSQ